MVLLVSQSRKAWAAGGVFRGFEDYSALEDGRIGGHGDADEGADVAEVRGAGDGEGDESELGVAGFGELGGLGDVFADDEFRGDDGGELEVFKGADGGHSVGRVELVGDGDFGDSRVAEGLERDGLVGGVFAGPEDEDAVGVGYGGLAVGEVVGDEFFGVDEVGGKKEILGVAVFDLLGESGRGAEGGDDLDARGVLVGGG